MRTIRMKFSGIPAMIQLGRERENGVTRVEIDCAAELAQIPGSTASITVEPPGGGKAAAYPAATKLEDGVLIWDIRRGDVARMGSGRMQIDILGADGEVFKSTISKIIVLESLGDPGAPAPECAQTWIEQARQELEASKEATQAASAAAETAQDAADEIRRAKEAGEFDGKDGAQGSQGEPGRDGQDGKDGAQGPQGEPGRDGQDGKDGAQGPRGNPGVYYGSGDMPEDATVQIDPEDDGEYKPYLPLDKTDEMTQPVGVDEHGKLFAPKNKRTAPQLRHGRRGLD